MSDDWTQSTGMSWAWRVKNDRRVFQDAAKCCKPFQAQTKLGASASSRPFFLCKLPGQQTFLRLSIRHHTTRPSGTTKPGDSAMSQSNGTSKSFDANPLEDDGSLDLATWIENQTELQRTLNSALVLTAVALKNQIIRFKFGYIPSIPSGNLT